MAMMRCAPAMRAASMQLNRRRRADEATTSPGRTPRCDRGADPPVLNSAAEPGRIDNGTDLSIFTSEERATTAYSDNAGDAGNRGDECRYG